MRHKVRFQFIPPIRERLASTDFSDAERRAFLSEVMRRVVTLVSKADGSHYAARSHPRLALYVDGSDRTLVAFDEIEYSTRVALINVVARELMREHGNEGIRLSGDARPLGDLHDDGAGRRPRLAHGDA